MTRLMGKGNKEKCWLSHFQHQHEIVIEGEGARFFLITIRSFVSYIREVLFSDTLKEQSIESLR